LGNRRQLKEFIRFPWKIYGDNPNWVPPLILTQLQFFTPGKNPYFAHSKAQLFMAFRGEEPVGRISAHENNQHIHVHEDGAGFFGFFECIDDHTVGQALLDAASNWLGERGLKTMRGPLSFSVNDEAGLLIDAFDEPPLIRMTYNPSYYAGLIEGYGLQKIQDLYAYAMFEGEHLSETVRGIADAALEDPKLVVRTINERDFKNEMEKIGKIYAEDPLAQTEDQIHAHAADGNPEGISHERYRCRPLLPYVRWREGEGPPEDRAVMDSRKQYGSQCGAEKNGCPEVEDLSDL
jgi:hypothetical protein